ncbi:hypothetical protein, partial [Robbsia andropogonis]|uniref:hypothetical protein n=1 Tax=Robbsia andropogonis TaxID=28092 RepID=UPI0020A083BD
IEHVVSAGKCGIAAAELVPEPAGDDDTGLGIRIRRPGAFKQSSEETLGSRGCRPDSFGEFRGGSVRDD